MKNTIQAELDEAKRMMIKDFAFQDNRLVELTRENVARVEAMIQNDSDYLLTSNRDAAPKFAKNKQTYGGSSAYWMTQLKIHLFEGPRGTKYSYEKIIKGAVESVDRENSTHLNADKCGREEIIKRILEFDRNELIKCLKDPDYEEMKLVREITRKTSAATRARTNLSFASKFCHYACFYVFEGTEQQDNYSIYDGILRTALPWYLDYYKLKQFDLRDYKEYRKAVDSVREACGVEISRNGFDHLLWYYHKGRL